MYFIKKSFSIMSVSFNVKKINLFHLANLSRICEQAGQFFSEGMTANSKKLKQDGVKRQCEPQNGLTSCQDITGIICLYTNDIMTRC